MKVFYKNISRVNRIVEVSRELSNSYSHSGRMTNDTCKSRGHHPLLLHFGYIMFDV